VSAPDSGVSPEPEFQGGNLEGKFGVDEDQASKYMDYLARFPRSKQICICGHTITSHRYIPSVGYSCKPNSMYCPCLNPRAVYFAGNARHFKRSTHGPGMKHALSQGIVKMTKSGSKGEWLEKLVCQVPGCTNLEIVPAPVNRDRRVTAEGSAFNVLLCREHVIEFGGDLIW
jgi:hypothetical protein